MAATARGQQPGWTIRVVPNKFPALGIEGDMDRKAKVFSTA